MRTDPLVTAPANVRAFVARALAAGLMPGRVIEPEWIGGDPVERIALEGERPQFEATGLFERVRWPVRYGKYWSTAGVAGRIERVEGDRFRLVLTRWRPLSARGRGAAIAAARADAAFQRFLRVALEAAADSLPRKRGDKRGRSPGKPRRA